MQLNPLSWLEIIVYTIMFIYTAYKVPYKYIVKSYVHEKTDVQMHDLCECIMQWFKGLQWLSLAFLSWFGYNSNNLKTSLDWVIFCVGSAFIFTICGKLHAPMKRLMKGFESKAGDASKSEFEIKWRTK